MRNTHLLSLAVIAAFLLVGTTHCGQQVRRGYMFGTGPVVTADDYSDILGTWTRSSKIYDGLDSKMFITATFHTPQFRQAFAVAFPHMYGHGGNITRRELAESDKQNAYHNFFVSAYTARKEWNDLDESDSIWRLMLTGAEGGSVAPVEVVPVKMDENLRAVYSYIGHFDSAYLVRFPTSDSLGREIISDQSNRVTLSIASALGIANLQWPLEPAANYRNRSARVPSQTP